MLPDLEKWLWSSLASSKSGSRKQHTKALVSPAALDPYTQGTLRNGTQVIAEVKFAEKIDLT